MASTKTSYRQPTNGRHIGDGDGDDVAGGLELDDGLPGGDGSGPWDGELEGG